MKRAISAIVGVLAVVAVVELRTQPMAAGSQRGPGLALNNGRVRAEFGERGLTSLTDLSVAQSVGFAEDDFDISVDGQPFVGQSLPAPVRNGGKDRVAYTWALGTYRLTVTYELAPGWRFLSKQITFERDPLARANPHEGKVHVDQVSLLRSRTSNAIADVFVPQSARPTQDSPTNKFGTGDYGACIRFDKERGLLAVAQNPFLRFSREGQSFVLRYKPDMDWHFEDGPFVSDRALLAPYRQTGRRLAQRMTPEWRMEPVDSQPGMDEAEVEAFTDMVRAFLVAPPSKPNNVLVGWCLNDYQIDVATEQGRSEYKRIIDRAADVGANYVLYAPSNSELSRRTESVDDWSWEHVLWLGLGQKIRKNEWDAKTSTIPASIQEMLDYARSKNIKLLAYVYPVMPFAKNPAWLVPARNPQKRVANLAFRSLQDFLIETLVTFHDRLGLGGFAFDYTFFNYEGASGYAQWAGWRRVMEELRRRIPDIVIDGRQSYHLYGPWGWLAGSYPHPTFNDEQPESFVPFPDLHFDRVSADRERFTAYRYRNYEFAPSELVPGFITHQTSRSDDTDEMPARKTDKDVYLLPFRARDWDLLGWRYSLLSSIAIGGWNNVIDMIPARDIEEDRAFTTVARKDLEFFRKWVDWTARNKEYLRHTKTILGQPAVGKIDGTTAIVGDRGFIFLFNPNGRRLSTEVLLDSTSGVPKDRKFILREVYPREDRLLGKPGSGVWSSGDRVPVSMDGGSALVLELQPVVAPAATPLVFNVQGSVSLANDVVSVTGATGEAGTSEQVLVVMPAGRSANAVQVNGQQVDFTRSGDTLSATVRFAGAPFRHYQQIGDYDPSFTGGRFTAKFNVPQRVSQQLLRRAKNEWPIPWNTDDYRATWLAPERLLMFVQIVEPDPKWEAQLWIDGRPVELRKAYSAIRTAPRTFVGFYADLSLISVDTPHTLELQLPTLKPGQLQGVFFENVETEYTDKIVK